MEIPSHSGICVLREEVAKRRLSRDNGLRNIKHRMSMALDTKKSILEIHQWLWFHIWFITSFFYKMKQLIYCKIRRKVIIKIRQVSCYKIRQYFLQNPTFITKWYVYYIMCRYIHQLLSVFFIRFLWTLICFSLKKLRWSGVCKQIEVINKNSYLYQCILMRFLLMRPNIFVNICLPEDALKTPLLFHDGGLCHTEISPLIWSQ